MKPTLRLLAAIAAIPLAAPVLAQDPPPPPDPPPAPSSASSTSVDTVIKDGKGSVTIIVEKDGKRETRTFDISSDDPAKLAERVTEAMRDAGGHASSDAPKRKVTYLGVMFAEEAGPRAGGGLFNVPGFGERRGRGAGGPPSPPDEAAAPGLPPGTGLPISGVSENSPAAKAGLQAGDVLARLDDQILVNAAQFTTLIRNKKEGDTIKLALVRNGDQKEMEITLASREESSPPVFGYAGGFGRGGTLRFPDTAEFGPGKLGDLREGRILRLDKDGRVIEERIGDVPPPPPAPPTPPAPAADPASRKRADALPQWEKALRDAAEVREKASQQWAKQLAEWREQWSRTQEKTAEDYRRAMEKMGEEIRKAGEAARKAQEEARRAIDAWREREKRANEKSGEEKSHEPKSDDPRAKEAPSSDQPKKVLSSSGAWNG
jgi:hypothetical protein